MSDRSKALTVLGLNTFAFTVCFACWMLNGVLVTFLVDNRLFAFDRIQTGWLLGVPVLTGSILRLPVGVLTDRFGGRIVFPVLMLLAAVPMFLLSLAESYSHFLAASFGFGLAGAGFAVGIAYTSVWFPKAQQGTALGVFGAGNAGAAVTSFGAPSVLKWLTDGGANLERWRDLPKLYAAVLAGTAVVFFLLAHAKIAEGQGKTLGQRLAPLRHVRVWRFGLYYFLVFGAFVALAQWLIPYYVSVYGMSLVTAGLVATIFSLPSGVIRALGGWLSDHYGARAVMYWVLGTCLVSCGLLVFPKMEVESPGESVIATAPGRVTEVRPDAIVVGEKTYKVVARDPAALAPKDDAVLVLPTMVAWQQPAVSQGDPVARKQLLARGVTRIHFQANVWIFTALVFVAGIAMGIGKAAVYRHIPDYFPQDVGVVGGIVGVVGGLGGFVCPIIFGWLLSTTGLWTTCWMLLTAISAVCLFWMHLVVRRILAQKAPDLVRRIETESGAAIVAAVPVGAPPAAPTQGVTT